MNRRPPRFIVSADRVNRRTRPSVPPPAVGNPVARGRIAAARARLELGLPLRRQLQRGQRRGRFGWRHVAGMLLAMTGLVLLFAAGLQSDIGVCALALLTIAAAALLLRRHDGRTCDTRVVWIDESVLRAFDRLLVAIAVDVEPRHRERLGRIKASVVGIVNASSVGDDDFVADDRHYVVECLRRYLPDSLTGYLAVPKAQRGDSATQASAGDLLDGQLSLLHEELRRLEARAAGSAAAALLRQQRFLASKRCGD